MNLGSFRIGKNADRPTPKKKKYPLKPQNFCQVKNGIKGGCKVLSVPKKFLKVNELVRIFLNRSKRQFTRYILRWALQQTEKICLYIYDMFFLHTLHTVQF